MQLLKLSLKNFKGIKSFEFEPNGQNAEIAGDNGTGKTTVADAYFFLINGKDSQNRADFEIKTLDGKGQVKKNLEHEVEGVFFTDREITLKKIYREVWTQRRGAAKKEFTGHTVDHFIDGVEKPKSDYDAVINEMAPDNVFRMLTDPRYFNEVMPWKSIVPKKGRFVVGRRDLLLETFGDVDDKEVIDGNPKLKELAAILGDRSLDDHRSIIKARQSKINEQLKSIPIRIDEINRGLPDVSDLSRVGLEKTIAGFNQEIKDLEAEKARIENSGQAAELQKQLRHAEAEQIDALNKVQKSLGEDSRAKERMLIGIEASIARIKNLLKAENDQLSINQQSIEGLLKQRKNLLAGYKTIRAESFDVSTLEPCEQCGHINGAEAAEKRFNKDKAELLEENKKNGLAVRKAIDSYTDDNETIQAAIVDFEREKEELEEQAEAVRAEIKELEATKPVVKDQKIEDLKKQIADLDDGGGAARIQEIEGQIHGVEVRKADVEDTLSAFKTIESAERRTAELEAEQKELAGEYEKLESELFLTDEFIRSKVNILESRINDKFKLVKFKLFDVQVNGAVSETCTVTVDGVPYSSMNNAARINCGLDIINTFAAIYDFSAPIFIDNAEAVNELFEVEGAQMVRLVVAKNKKLKVNINENQKAAEAA